MAGNFPKILVCAPHADRKNYSISRWLSQVKHLTYKNYDVFVADNSHSKKNAKWLRKQRVLADWVKPKNKSNIQYIAESHELCRRTAIYGHYDYMLHWETDIEAPPNTIERLLMHNKKVVSGVYPIGFGEKSKLLLQFSEKISESMSVTSNAEHTDMSFIDGKVKKVFACGLGLTLISRKIFTTIPFRFEYGVYAHPDTLFAYDLFQKGIAQWVDTSLICSHDNSEWIHF